MGEFEAEVYAKYSLMFHSFLYHYIVDAMW